MTDTVKEIRSRKNEDKTMLISKIWNLEINLFKVDSLKKLEVDQELHQIKCGKCKDRTALKLIKALLSLEKTHITATKAIIITTEEILKPKITITNITIRITITTNSIGRRLLIKILKCTKTKAMVQIIIKGKIE